MRSFVSAFDRCREVSAYIRIQLVRVGPCSFGEDILADNESNQQHFTYGTYPQQFQTGMRLRKAAPDTLSGSGTAAFSDFEAPQKFLHEYGVMRSSTHLISMGKKRFREELVSGRNSP